MEEVSLYDDDEDHGEYQIDQNKEATPAPYELEEIQSPNENKAWVDAYKKLMHQSINSIHGLAVSKSWKLIPSAFIESSAFPSILLFECDRNAQHGFYTVKAQAVLNVRPERLAYVIRDHNPDTRLAWDSEYVESCKELDNFCTDEGEIKFVTTIVKTNIPFVHKRCNLGISWYGYDCKTQVYKYVFRTTQHKMHKAPKDTVATITLTGVFIRTLEKTEEGKPQCELIIIVHTNPGNSFLSSIANGICKEWLRERVSLYEKVTLQWDKYYASSRK
jgi:hypothetical protein